MPVRGKTHYFNGKCLSILRNLCTSDLVLRGWIGKLEKNYFIIEAKRSVLNDEDGDDDDDDCEERGVNLGRRHIVFAWGSRQINTLKRDEFNHSLISCTKTLYILILDFDFILNWMKFNKFYDFLLRQRWGLEEARHCNSGKSRCGGLENAIMPFPTEWLNQWKIISYLSLFWCCSVCFLHCFLSLSIS